MKWKKVTRWQASGVHLLISAAIAAGALALMLLVWYPHPLFKAAGGDDLLLILVGVDVIIGPLITLIIFKPGKKGLKFDLLVIGVLQLSALVYGVSIVYLARPAYIVFVKDRFEVVTAAELQPEHLAEAKFPEFRAVPVTGPRWVYGEFPTDPKERTRLLELNLSGYDMQHFPRYFRPYEPHRADILARGQTIERTRKTEPKAGRVVDAWLAETGISPDSVRYLDLRAPRYWVAVLVDAKTAEPVKMLIYDRL
ncbi:MAG TPA: TfpX/TfpZ family type IV pilin accessory protein [Burkholderiales bacterium]|nr:TfpX/TfpZ family type IV pilin accessory protein [Burkholderiales bacterium]